MSALTRRQFIWASDALAALDPKSPDFRASDDVKEALTGPLKNYLDAWVLPNLISLLQDGGFRKNANGYWYKVEP